MGPPENREPLFASVRPLFSEPPLRLGGGKNAAKGVPLRIILKGESFSPLYWKTQHLALVDMQRQCGFPTLFKTMAPWEPSFPYHAWVLHEMRSARLPRQHLAGPETLHTAHVFTELQRGFYTGMNAQSNTRGSRCWTNHLFSAAEDETVPTVVNYFHRLEFQDGKRKLPSQAYHGSGRVHCHSLDYLQNVGAIGFPEKLRADIPDAESEPVLRGYVLGRPHGRDDSGWPVHDGPSRWDAEANAVRLHHPPEAKEIGNRAYFVDTLEVTKCHQDVLHANGRGMVLKYVSTYNAKFSDSFATEWLNDDASDYSVARRVLHDYQPCEPEMWLYLCSQLFPPCKYGGTKVELRAPWPGMEKKPKEVLVYEEATWRGNDMPMLEFLRKSNENGDIIDWLVKKHRCTDTTATLIQFAREYQTRGEKVIAAEMYWRMNDKYFGQWLALNVPFAALQDLLVAEVVNRVPPQYMYVALAMHWRPRYWRDDDAIRADMELEACNSGFIDTFLAMLRANRYLVEKYLSGELSRMAEDRERLERRARRDGGFHSESDTETDSDGDEREGRERVGERMVFIGKQRLLRDRVNRLVDVSVEAHAAKNDAEYNRIADDARDKSVVLAALGEPGTGKTTVLLDCVKRCLRKGGNALIACPTAQHAARLRAKVPEADVDTCSGAFFLYKPLHEVDAVLTQYDLVVVDEVSQLSAEDFERIVQLWEASDRLPCLVFAGDFWQLPGINPERANKSPKWRQYVKTIELFENRRCDCPKLTEKLKAIRTAMPTKRMFNKIMKGHRAWRGHHEPTLWDIQQILRRTDERTTFVTCTRRMAAKLNDMVLMVLFSGRRKRPIGELPCDWESNPANYGPGGKLIEGQAPKPLWQKIYKGMKVRLTKNRDKPHDFVNGMAAHVREFDAGSGCLLVQTVTGFNHALHPHTDDVQGCGRVVAYPFRPGYAANVAKLQGSEEDHVTIWLDRKYCRAAAYVAMSRVRKDADYLIGGLVSRKHFFPAM